MSMLCYDRAHFELPAYPAVVWIFDFDRTCNGLGKGCGSWWHVVPLERLGMRGHVRLCVCAHCVQEMESRRDISENLVWLMARLYQFMGWGCLALLRRESVFWKRRLIFSWSAACCKKEVDIVSSRLLGCDMRTATMPSTMD